MILLSSKALTQNIDNEEIIDPIDIHAEFPGGVDSLWCFIETTLNYRLLNFSNKTGRIFTTFEIDTSGVIKKIITNPEHLMRFDDIIHDTIMENEIQRVIKLMPEWTPAFQWDKKLPMEYTLIFNIPYTNFRCLNSNQDTSLYQDVDSLADFKFGKGTTTIDRINSHLFSQLKWPSEADCVGTVYIQVIVEIDGSLSNFKIIRSLCNEFDEEALRVIKLMSNWTPAKKDGMSVRSYFVIPVNFKIE